MLIHQTMSEILLIITRVEYTADLCCREGKNLKILLYTKRQTTHKKGSTVKVTLGLIYSLINSTHDDDPIDILIQQNTPIHIVNSGHLHYFDCSGLPLLWNCTIM